MTGDRHAVDVSARPRRVGRTELALFLSVYLVYKLARWLFVGDLDAARDARSIGALEQSVGLAIERPVQDALDFAAANWLHPDLRAVPRRTAAPGRHGRHRHRKPTWTSCWPGQSAFELRT
jgi:hypothetical protein